MFDEVSFFPLVRIRAYFRAYTSNIHLKPHSNYFESKINQTVTRKCLVMSPPEVSHFLRLPGVTATARDIVGVDSNDNDGGAISLGLFTGVENAPAFRQALLASAPSSSHFSPATDVALVKASLVGDSAQVSCAAVKALAAKARGTMTTR